ncbi:juvenile hormone acid O-methyltransferase-like [Rhodnius prolixus]
MHLETINNGNEPRERHITLRSQPDLTALKKQSPENTIIYLYIKTARMAMRDPKTYHNYCDLAGQMDREVLSYIKDLVSLDDKEHVLDVGCGPGINTYRNMTTFLPKGSTVTGVDISSEMVEFAEKHYSSPSMKFIKLDITDSNLWPTWRKEEFSKVFSFFTLHRVLNQRKAYENMYNLLKPGGEIITVTPIEDGLDILAPFLARLPKYAKYADKIKRMNVQFNPSENNFNETKNILEGLGFKIKICETMLKTFCAPSIDYVAEFYGVISCLSNILPKKLYDEALTDIKKILIENELLERCNRGYILKYNLLVVLAKKKEIKNETKLKIKEINSFKSYCIK